MNGEITLNFLEFSGASEASVDCFQRLERSQKFPSHCEERSNIGWQNFLRKF